MNHMDFSPLGLLTIALDILIILFSLSVHESAHAWMADKLGDSTGRMLGRITLNPIPHIDPIGTILVPLVMSLAGGPIFGWAKPVPMITRNFKHIKRDTALVGVAGPLSNLLLAILSTALMGVLLAVLGPAQFFTDLGTAGTGPYWILQLAFINLVLAAFNLIPVPPLDGSWVLAAVLPRQAEPFFDGMRRIGPILLLVLFLTPILGLVLTPIIRVLAGVIIFLPLHLLGALLG